MSFSSQYFRAVEFNCRCGNCDRGLAQIHPEALSALEQARAMANIPFNITSAIRCAAHNRQVGGSPTSSHLDGWAFDIAAPGVAHRWAIVNGALRAGFRRIGVGQTFVHLDLDPDKPQEVLWLYPS